MSDTSELQTIIEKIVKDNPKSVEDIAAGNKKAYGFLTGVMKVTKARPIHRLPMKSFASRAKADKANNGNY